jgi:hypothetical protein
VLRVHDVGLRGNRVIRWMAGLAVAALLVGGGVALGANLTAGDAKSQASVRLVSNAAIKDAALGGLSGPRLRHDLAGLRKCLGAARQLRKSGHRAAARAKRRACVRQYHARGLLLLRRLLLSGGEHGQITFKSKKGTRTVAFERGVVQAVSSSSVVIKAADGTTLTWHLVSKTAVVRVKHRPKHRLRVLGRNRSIDRVSASALAAGQRVFVVGAVVGGTDDARLIIIRG